MKEAYMIFALAARPASLIAETTRLIRTPYFTLDNLVRLCASMTLCLVMSTAAHSDQSTDAADEIARYQEIHILINTKSAIEALTKGYVLLEEEVDPNGWTPKYS